MDNTSSIIYTHMKLHSIAIPIQYVSTAETKYYP